MTGTLITGAWIFENGKIVSDEAGQIIKKMLKEDLHLVHKGNGWVRLYQDTERGYWELTYPQSYLHGGGPQQLEKLTITSPDEWVFVE